MTICPKELNSRVVDLLDTHYAGRVIGWHQEWEFSCGGFIRRGTLLLKVASGAAYGLTDLWVVPADAEDLPITLKRLQDRPGQRVGNVFPVAKDIAINVSSDEGPWWDLLAAEVTLMEGEVEAAKAAHKERERQTQQEKDDAHQAKMDEAAGIVRAAMQKWGQ